MSQKKTTDLDFNYKYGFAMPDKSTYKTKRGLNERTVQEISEIKKEPKWMTDFRIKSYRTFLDKPMPSWGANLSDIQFDDILYYARPSEHQVNSWEDLPAEIKETYDKIGVPEAEKKFLAG